MYSTKVRVLAVAAWMVMFLSGPICMLAWALQFVRWSGVGFGIRPGIVGILPQHGVEEVAGLLALVQLQRLPDPVQ